MPDFPHRHSAMVVAAGIDLRAVLVDEPEVAADDQRPVPVGRDRRAVARCTGALSTSSGGFRLRGQWDRHVPPTAPPALPGTRPVHVAPVGSAARLAVGGPAVEDLLHDLAGAPGGPAVVVEELPGSMSGPYPHARATPASSRPGRGSWSLARPRTRKIAFRARVARSHAERSASACSPSSSPASPRAASASTVGAARSAGTSAACWSCSSWTVHSTSASPPRPSLVCVAGSAPRGSRSRSTRALIRRISATCSLGQAARPGTGCGSISATNSRAELRVAGHRHRPQQRLHLPDRHPALVVLAEGRRGCGPARPAAPRAAGRRRPRAPGRAPARPSSRRSVCATALAAAVAFASSAPGRGPVDEQHVGVGAEAHLAAAEPAHADDREVHGQVGGVDAGLERVRPPATSRPTCSVATAMSVSACPTRTTSSRPSRSAAATRSSSCRRSPRSTWMPACGSGARPAAWPPRAGQRRRAPRLELGVVGEEPQRLRASGSAARRCTGWSRAAGPAARRPDPRRAAGAGTTGCRRAPR